MTRLGDHPGIEVTSRDRAGAYAEAANKAAPRAVQVADRWHRLRNLTDGLQHCLASLQGVEEAQADVYLVVARDRHNQGLGPCPRESLPKGTTRTDRMRRQLQTKAGRAIYAARKASHGQTWIRRAPQTCNRFRGDSFNDHQRQPAALLDSYSDWPQGGSLKVTQLVCLIFSIDSPTELARRITAM
jgi:hypothetical protein